MHGGSQHQVDGQTHYERNKKEYIQRAQERKRSNIEYVRDIKRQGQCVDCGIKDWRVLDFDHLDADTKIACISDTHATHWGRKRIDAEIAKCELVCSNCHRIRTF